MRKVTRILFRSYWWTSGWGWIRHQFHILTLSIASTDWCKKPTDWLLIVLLVEIVSFYAVGWLRIRLVFRLTWSFDGMYDVWFSIKNQYSNSPFNCCHSCMNYRIHVHRDHENKIWEIALHIFIYRTTKCQLAILMI